MAHMLFTNSTLVTLDLKNNLIGDSGTRKLMLALRKNQAVEKRVVKMGKNRAKGERAKRASLVKE